MLRMDLTRRSFLAGIGGVTVGLLFRRKLERVLGELEAESAAELAGEPARPGQLPAAAEITVEPSLAFRPERLVIAGVATGEKRMVPRREWRPCLACDGQDEIEDCEACNNMGGDFVETGELEERAVTVIPWEICDITIGDRSQFVASGPIPGEVFGAASGIDSALSMDAAAPGIAIRFRVRYIGDNPEGECFRAALLGRSADCGSRLILPISSAVPILPATSPAAIAA